MDEREKELRQQFFRETGKTPEEEGRDAAIAMGLALIWAFFVCIMVAWGLIAYYW